MFYESLAHARSDERDRELTQSLRTRLPMHDRPGRQLRGLQRLGRWIAAVGAQLASRRTRLPEGAELARVTIRPAEETDGRDIARLSELDERHAPSGYVLVAELDESIIAVMPLDGGHTVTDPRRSTADVVELLEVRSRQLRNGANLADAA